MDMSMGDWGLAIVVGLVVIGGLIVHVKGLIRGLRPIEYRNHYRNGRPTTPEAEAEQRERTKGWIQVLVGAAIALGALVIGIVLA